MSKMFSMEQKKNLMNKAILHNLKIGIYNSSIAVSNPDLENSAYIYPWNCSDDVYRAIDGFFESSDKDKKYHSDIMSEIAGFYDKLGEIDARYGLHVRKWAEITENEKNDFENVFIEIVRYLQSDCPKCLNHIVKTRSTEKVLKIFMNEL
jgi:hypothetical protein